MRPLSPFAKNLRCTLTILAAMLAPLGEAVAREHVNWPATICVVSGAGIIAWRAWLDQSLSQDEVPDASAPSSAAPETNTQTAAPMSSPQPSPLSKAVLSRS